ncbi:MAG: bifunctional UDP-N-acetylglucosamine diphosphorylase/glucosamine-1-phosphate N-acetyltransferase GlmU [Clostridiales bacterium]|nr:bifunctional UDP-N-acetylglucosamine diphosphorylase/glucosamine-1-phosphate N-acetyltransferase GlmU [Clostridiales bacterium]
MFGGIKLKAIVLAAGSGTRMKSGLPKCIHKILGRTLLNIALDTLQEAGIRDIIVVTGCGEELLRASVSANVQFAHQAEQKGTGHAVSVAKEFLNENEDILVLCGDTPLVTAETLHKLAETHTKEGNAITVVSTRTDNPFGYGRIIRPVTDGQFLRVVEHRDLEEGQELVNEINTAVYMFNGKALLDALPLIEPHNAAGEYYLPDSLEIIQSSGLKAGVLLAPDFSEFVGVNNRVQLSQAAEVLKKRINERHMMNGVTITDPNSAWISHDVSIGADTVIYPGVILENTRVGENCVIGPNTRIVGSDISDFTEIDSSVILDSFVGEHTAVGPFAYLRPHSRVGARCKIGDFVEVKNSAIGDNTKASHLTYIGDSDVGSGINFGCGSVTVNYDGKKKFRTVIEDNAFIGCNANLIAPVIVKEGAYIAAGSTITEDVPKKALSIARARQVNKEDWVKRKRG